MKKRILSLVLALAMVVVTAFASVAATRQGTLDLADLRRFQETVSSVRGKKAKIINYQKITPSEYMVKLEVKDAQGLSDQCAGDFRVKFSANPPAVGSNLGACWYWFGLFDNTFNICGYGIATREYQHMAGHYYTYPQPDSWVIPEFQ